MILVNYSNHINFLKTPLLIGIQVWTFQNYWQKTSVKEREHELGQRWRQVTLWCMWKCMYVRKWCMSVCQNKRDVTRELTIEPDHFVRNVLTNFPITSHLFRLTDKCHLKSLLSFLSSTLIFNGSLFLSLVSYEYFWNFYASIQGD